MNKLLSDYKQFLVFDSDLLKAFGSPLIQASVPEDEIELVTTDDVIRAIKKYLSGEISQEVLLDWVNTLWFTDLFSYFEEQSDSIASVMTELETLDEDGVFYTDEDYERMIYALENNISYIG